MPEEIQKTESSEYDQEEIPNSTFAVVSLIAGILGVSFIPFVGSIAAVITGMMAKKEIRESSGTLEGEGLATAGLVLGWLGIGVSVVGLCMAGVVIGFTVCILFFSVSTVNLGSLLPLLIFAL